jgi:hypothetical protein
MGRLGELPERERLSLLDQVRSLLDADEYRQSWETRVYWTRLEQKRRKPRKCEAFAR